MTPQVAGLPTPPSLHKPSPNPQLSSRTQLCPTESITHSHRLSHRICTPSHHFLANKAHCSLKILLAISLQLLSNCLILPNSRELLHQWRTLAVIQRIWQLYSNKLPIHTTTRWSSSLRCIWTTTEWVSSTPPLPYPSLCSLTENRNGTTRSLSNGLWSRRYGLCSNP
jgi:hypothetical protein